MSMNAKLLQKKKSLLNRISLKEYYQLLSYVEEVYLADYDLKILLARKFSNLFCALLQLMIAEDRAVTKKYDKMVAMRREKGMNPPVIISSRALEYYKEDVQNHTFTTILLADDMIVHGGTLQSIFEKITDWADNRDDITVAAWAYASVEDLSIQGKDEYDEFLIKNRDCKVVEWRTISSKIVETMYIMSQPYTSYVPNYKFNYKEEPNGIGSLLLEYKRKNEQNDVFYELTDTELHGVKAYVWLPDSVEEFISFACVRVYINEFSNEITIVPLVSLKPINEELLICYLQKLGKYMDTNFYDKVMNLKGELAYRTIAYTLSALLAQKFMLTTIGKKMETDDWVKEEERINFGNSFLIDDTYEETDLVKIEQIFQEINEAYRSECKKDSFAQEKEKIADMLDFEEMGKCLENFLTEFKKSKCNGKFLEFVRGYAYKSCRYSEEQWNRRQKGSAYPNRLKGYPVFSMIEKLKDHFMTKAEAVRSILNAIDMGAASLITESFRIEGNSVEQMFIPLIHDGEQNYKYVESNYFPFLYGAYLLEQKEDKLSGNGEEKQEFYNLMLEYWKKNDRFYLESDIDDIKTQNITGNYDELIGRDIFLFQDDPAVAKAEEIVESLVNMRM